MLRLSVSLAATLALSGCIRTRTDLDFGSCAGADGAIGTCLAGPIDIDFVERDGRTFLLVANSDPYRNFDGGSLLVVPFDSIDLYKPSNLMGEIEGAVAVPTEAFLGGMAKIAGDRLAITSRFSPDGATADDIDSLLLFDIKDPTSPKRLEDAEGNRVEDVLVGLDPEAIVADPATDRLFVLNNSQGNLSAFTTTSVPFIPLVGNEDANIVATGSSVSEPSTVGLPAPAAGRSMFELGALTIADESLIPDDEWTMTWVEGTFRLWAPSGDGLARHTTGGLDYVDGGLATELSPSDSSGAFVEIRDPFMGSVEGRLASFFADRDDLKVALWDDDVGDWDSSSAAFPLLIGRQDTFMARVGGPSVLQIAELTALFFEGRTSADAPPNIGLATSTGGTFVPVSADDVPTPIVPMPDGFVGVGDPFLRADPITGTFRMWVSLLDAAGDWSIGHTESDDGLKWTAPIEVLAGDADLAAPVVTWSSGRYLMWATARNGEGVQFVRAESYDGFRWTEPSVVIDSELPWDEADPPRLGLQTSATSSWLVSSRDQVQNGFLARAGATNIPGAFGYTVRVASGFDLGTGPFGDQAKNGVVPGSVARIAGVDRLFVTTIDDNDRERISVLARTGDVWTLRAVDVIDTDAAGVSDPVVYDDGGTWRMAYAEERDDGVLRLRNAFSADGLEWTVDAGDALASETNGWDALAQVPHSIEQTPAGVRLWYAGSNGSRFRIGSALLDGDRFVPEPGPTDPWQLDFGAAGDIDDSGVRDPLFVSDGVTDELWYSAFDGNRWRIAHASRPVGAASFTRTVDSAGQVAVALSGFDRTFAAAGVYGPVAWQTSAGLELLYAGFDGENLTDRTVSRVGRATPSPTPSPTASPDGRLGRLFPEMRPPTPGDQLFYSTRADRSAGIGIVDLSRSVHGFVTSGTAGTALVLDEELGFLYLTSKSTNYILVLDVRDDSTVEFADNFLGIEAVVSVLTVEGPRGIRDVEIDSTRDHLLISTVSPEAVFVLDRSQILDDDRADLLPTTPIGALPVGRAVEDANDVNFTGGLPIGPGDMALSDDGHLFVPNFAEDAVSIFDLGLGAWGREVRTVANVGGNPWLVRLTPDGKYAIVANYTGDVDNELVSSSLAILDADPDSPTAFQVLTWLENR